jgi:cyclopropane-fatty-acyl-phospholipid synthase
LEEANLDVLHTENLRQDYELTLQHWLERFDESYESVCRMFGEEFARMWRLYLAGSVVAFRVGTLQLFQIVFAGRYCKQIPWNRERLFSLVERRATEDSCIHAMSS